MSAPDKYDEAIAYLTEHPDEIHAAWADGWVKGEVDEDEPRRKDSCLFDLAGPKGCGCLTQVKLGKYEAMTTGLTTAIRADHRIPLRPQDITVDHLEHFADWQRKIDAMGLGATS